MNIVNIKILFFEKSKKFLIFLQKLTFVLFNLYFDKI